LRASGELVGVNSLGRHRLTSVLAPVVIAVTAFGLAACNKGGPSTSPTSPGSVTASPDVSDDPGPTGNPTPSTSAPQLIEFRTDGAGPYLLGATLTQLQEGQPGLDDVRPLDGCPGNTTARGVGTWRDVQLSFRADGRLYLLVNRSLSIPTPSGAYLGTTLTDRNGLKGLKTIYAGLVTYELPQGNPTAFLVQTLAGGGILFELNENEEVTAMYAAQANYLRNTYTPGAPLC